MKLYEFFGVPQYQENNNDQDRPHKTRGDEEKMEDELYWYILDHDRLHKECFIPLAREIQEKIQNKSLDRKVCAQKFMPMVNKACMEYYKERKLTKDPKDIFTVEMRKGLCQRLADQSVEDIEKGEYKLN